jgi:membrane-associated protease RseP (regulator of RpoE activity)
MNGMGRGRLGVRAEDLSSDLAPYFDAPSGSGALVMEVLKDTPAERAGLKAGDVVIRVGDQRISGADDLVRTLREAPEGRISMTVLRHGSRRTFEPELGQASRWSDNGRGSTSFGPNGPGNGRVIIRDRNGTRVYRDQGNGGTRDQEMQQLREEVRRLREQLNEQKDKNNDEN